MHIRQRHVFSLHIFFNIFTDDSNIYSLFRKIFFKLEKNLYISSNNSFEGYSMIL